MTDRNPRNRARLATGDDGFELRLTGVVGDFFDGFTDDDVSDLTTGLTGPGTVVINSPGGLVFQGIDIFHQLAAIEGITVRIQGLAASIASVIALAGSRVEIARGSMMMIHNPWNVAMGDAQELRKSADVLDQIKESILDIYQAKTGQEREFLTEIMDEETWLTADEAVEFGFADAVVGDENTDASAAINRCNLSILAGTQHMPERIAALAKHQSAPSRSNRAAAPIHPETEDSTMPEENSTTDPAAPETANTPDSAGTNSADAQAAAQSAVEAERTRCNTIKRLCADKKLDNDFRDRLIDDGVELTQAESQINMLADYLANNVGNIGGGNAIEITRDERDTTRNSVATALLNRFNPSRYQMKGDDPGREWAGMSLREMAREFAEMSGKRTRGMGVHEVARAALHSTSDFPLILENVVGKTLRDGYELAPRTFLPLARRATLPDYKEVSRVQMGEAPKLQKVLEGGEYTYGTVGEAAEKYRLFKYGKVLAITSEIIINDDLDAFTRVPALMGAAAGQLESELFWAQVTGNPNMSDGNALFSTSHGNLQDTGSAISIVSIGEGRKFMRQQKGLNEEHFINVQPSFLVVPTEQETLAEQFVSQNLQPDSSGNINPFAGRLQVVSEPRLDAASTKAWYLWADPNMVDTFEYGFLQGEEGPQVETSEGFDVDGVKVKVRHNFAAKPIDWRGMFRNDGE